MSSGENKMIDTTQRLLLFLQQTGVSAHKIEQECGLANASIQAWKSGKANPSQKSLQKIANYFKVSIDFLLFGNDLSSYAEKKETAKSLISDLTPEEVKKLLEYKDFLISQRNKK